MSAPPGRTPTPQLILVLGACGFASSFNMRLMDPIMPDLARAFATGVADVAVFTTAFGFAYAAGQPIFGPLADAVGKVRTIRFAIFGLVGLLVATALVASYGQMMALRITSGLIAGGIIPVALAAIGDRVELAERQIAISRFLVIVIVGQMAGATVSGLVADTLGWRAVFIVAGIVALTGGTLAVVFIAARARRPEPPTVAGVMAGYRSVFANPATIPVYLLVCCGGMCAFGVYPFIASTLEARSGTGASEAGLVVGAAGCGGLVFGVFVRQILAGLGQARMTRIGGVLMAAMLLAFALPLPWWTAPAIFFVHGFGFWLIHTTLQTVATDLSQTARGAGVALFAAFFFCGNALGPLVMAGAKLLYGIEVGLVAAAVGIVIVGFVTPRAIGLQRPR